MGQSAKHRRSGGSVVRAGGFVTALVTALVIGFAGAAEARVLGFQGTLSLQVGSLAEIRVSGSGSAILNQSTGGLGGPLNTIGIATPSLISGTVKGVSVTGISLLRSVEGTARLGTGVLAPISGGVSSAGPLTQNRLPVAGTVRLCFLFAGCGSFLPIPLTVGGTRGAGIGGLVTVNTFGAGGLKVSLLHAPWTVRTAVITGVPTVSGGTSTLASVAGFAHGPASGTSSILDVNGVVQLVAPTLVLTNQASLAAFPIYSVLTLRFVPEPGTLALFGLGIAGLGMGCRRRIAGKATPR